MDVVEPIESKRRSRTTMIAATVGAIAAAVLVGYGFSRSDDDREPASNTSPTIGVIQAPADVLTTQGVVAVPGPTESTDDVPLVPDGTVDVAFPPPVSVDIPSP